MQITKKIIRKYVVLGVRGNLNMNNVHFIKQIFENEINKGVKFIVIDMKDLTYIDSSGIGSLINLMSKLRSISGQICLMNMRQDIERIFSMTKLLSFFKIFKNEEEFINSLGVQNG
ncbi:MAG: STAS domain-containing protein [bacterium]|nr:STAS domain-containing protein [bacterium]